MDLKIIMKKSKNYPAINIHYDIGILSFKQLFIERHSA